MFNLDSALGIELQASRLVMASVSKGFQGFTLRSHLIVENFRELPQPELAGRIRSFVQKNGFNSENIIAGLSRDQVIVREVEFPIEVEENLEQVVRAQVERFEPSEEGKSYFDFRVLGRNEEARRITLQIVMARQQEVLDFLGLLESLGMYPLAMRYSSVGLERVVSVAEEGPPKKSAFLVVRFDQGRVEVVASTSDQRLFSDYFAIPEQQLDITGLLNRVAEVISPLAEQVPSFSGMYLTGDRASEIFEDLNERIPDAELLRKGLNLKRRDVPQETLEMLIPAIGLAVSGVLRRRGDCNLIPQERRRWGGRPKLVPTYVLAGVLLVVLGALGTRGYFQQTALAEQLDGQVQALQSEVDAVFALRDQVAGMKSEVEELQSLLRGRQRTLLVLRDLTERIPDHAYLQTLQIQGDQLTMQGYSEQASELLPILLESPYLESVKTNWITQDPRVSGKERFNFSAQLGSEPK